MREARGGGKGEGREEFPELTCPRSCTHRTCTHDLHCIRSRACAHVQGYHLWHQEAVEQRAAKRSSEQRTARLLKALAMMTKRCLVLMFQAWVEAVSEPVKDEVHAHCARRCGSCDLIELKDAIGSAQVDTPLAMT